MAIITKYKPAVSANENGAAVTSHCNHDMS